MNHHIDLSDADTEAVLLRSLSALTDQLKQANDDKRTLAIALIDIEGAAAYAEPARELTLKDEALRQILHVVRLPAIRNAMGGD